MILKAVEDMKQKALEITGGKLEEYRHAQDAEFRRLETLADDSRKLDIELRRSMQDTIDKAREDFTLHERESAEMQKAETAKFLGVVSNLREELLEMEKEFISLNSVEF